MKRERWVVWPRVRVRCLMGGREEEVGEREGRWKAGWERASARTVQIKGCRFGERS